MSIKYLTGAASVALLLAAAPAGAETLFDALVQAYVSNPELQARRAALRSVDEGVPQALSGWRPTVSLAGSAGLQRSRSTTTSNQSLTPRSYSLNLSQPLYSGGRTEAATRSAESDVAAARAQLATTEQQILLGGVTAFLDVLRDQARVQLTAGNESVLRRQLEATKDRFEVGEVTRTDVAQAEARLAGAIATRAAAQGDLATSRATYREVFGAPPGALQPAPPLPALPANEAEVIGIAEAENPEILAALHVEAAAAHAVDDATGRLLPSVDLVGRVLRSDETTFENNSSRADSINAEVTVPLYQAGAVHAAIRAAKETRNQRRIEVESTRRDVIESASKAWEQVESTRSQIAARSEEIRANEIALEGVRQEAEVGSRTTLDVLDAEQELLDARVALVISERNEYVAGYQLLAAVGRLTAQQIGLPVEIYDPEKHYRQIRNKWWGWKTPKD
ncbi:MAG: TolC family outer membrane protein [Alphaproteobacteria bacterium]|jgi:TolC family type I secretion outer membrane protein|nr:TolC family outer membrane protein [Alphaproteobacteria bacterium]